jgi:transposase
MPSRNAVNVAFWHKADVQRLPGLANLFRRGSARFEAGKADALARLRQAEAVASDETGVRIEGANSQHWVFLAKDAVVHEAAYSRGAQVVRDVMGG